LKELVCYIIIIIGIGYNRIIEDNMETVHNDDLTSFDYNMHDLTREISNRCNLDAG